MTEYEIADLTASVMANYLTSFTIFLTLTSAYGITAFIAGPRLTHAQSVVVTIGFVIAAFLASGMCAEMLARTFAIGSESPVARLGGPSPTPVAAYAVTALLHGIIIFGCVWFMRGVRAGADQE